MNTPLSGLIDKEVSRGEFLSLLGLAVASVFGLGAVLKLLTGKSLDQHTGVEQFGYGSSAYGGPRGAR
jgi:hypothetical protein